MRKNVFGKKLKRDINERKALFKSLMSSLVLNESIKTTESKAKAIRPEIEKLITKAKNGESGAQKVLKKSLSQKAFVKIINDLGPRFSKRNGGYTRIVKLGKRLGDNAPVVIIEFVEKASAVVPVLKSKDKKEKKQEKPKTKEVKTKKSLPKTSKKKEAIKKPKAK